MACSRLTDQTTSSKEQVVGDFKALVAKNFLEQKDVSFYASALNITPKYLSQVLLSETGKTAKTLILEHVLLEAKSLLRQTPMTVLEICNWLGYYRSLLFYKSIQKIRGLYSPRVPQPLTKRSVIAQCSIAGKVEKYHLF